MALTDYERLELKFVSQIGKPEPATLITGMPWTDKNNASSHSNIENFRDRQIARGMKPREGEPK